MIQLHNSAVVWAHGTGLEACRPPAVIESPDNMLSGWLAVVYGKGNTGLLEGEFRRPGHDLMELFSFALASFTGLSHAQISNQNSICITWWISDRDVFASSEVDASCAIQEVLSSESE